MGAGTYNELFTRLQHTAFLDTEFGGDTEDWIESDQWWGHSKDLTATERIAYGVLTHTTAGKIIIRNVVDLSPLDRLRDVDGAVWSVDGITYGDDETIVMVSTING